MLTWPFSLLAFKKSPPCPARTTRSRGNKNRQAGEAMAELPNSAIKLFGKTIPLKPSPSTLSPASSGQESSSIEEEKDIQNQEVSPEWKEQDHEPKQQSGCNEKQVLKKPTKILPCPRCSSTDTKFCYFNNYNVNQPRHFCKKCQRYWTAGGAMRNVPVGSGRRKTKNTDAGVKDVVRSGISEPVHGASGCSTVLSFSGHRSVAPPPSAEHLSEPYATAPISSSMESPWPYHCIPIPFFPVAAYWSVPWASPVASVSPGDGCARGEGTNYSILGKRSRNGTLFKNQAAEASQLLHHANPAALARSINFQESS